MAYSEFTLYDVKQRWHLSIDETTDLFSTIPEVAVSHWLTETLQETLPLALALSTEKSRSELLIAPLLVELRKRTGYQVSVFSGVDFPVDASQGLNGSCDFLVALSPEQLFVSTPVLIIVEAKNDNIKSGLAQCMATMVAARLLNDREGTAIPIVYGAVTTGTTWRFLQLEADVITLDRQEYYINRAPLLLGILLHMVGLHEAQRANVLQA